MAGPRSKKQDSTPSNALEDSILSQMGEDDLIEGGEGEEELEEEETEGGEEEETEEEVEEEEGEEEEGEEEDEDEEGDDDLVNLKVKPDKKGNLIDPKTGKIVAQAGPARRFYEQLRGARNRQAQLEQTLTHNRNLLGQASQALTELNAKVQAYEKQGGLGKELGLSNDEYAEALQFMARFKNPATAVDAIKQVLTRAAQRGIKLDGLEGSTLDVNTLTSDIFKKIEEKFGPITDRVRASDEQTEQRARAEREVNTFLADPFEGAERKRLFPVLMQMAQRPEFQNMTLTESWLHLQNYLLRNPQRKSKAPDDLVNRRSRPGGRNRPGPEGSEKPDDSPVGADVSYKDIVRSVVKEYGGIDK